MSVRNTIYRLLRLSERYTKTDMLYLAKGGSWVSIGNAAASLTSLATAVAFANFLPQQAYGEYKYVLAALGLLSLTTLPGINTALSHAVARGSEGDIYTSLRTKLTWGLLGSVISLGIALYYFVQGHEVFPIYFLLIALLLPAYNSFTVFRGYLNGKKLFRANAIIKSLAQIVGSLIIIATVYLTENVLILVTVFLITYTVLNISSFWYAIKRYVPNQVRENAIGAYGKQLSGIEIMSAISATIDTFIIWHFLGAHQLAVYLFARLPVDQLRLLFKFTTPLAVPKLVHKDAAQMRRILPQKMFRFGALIAVMVTLYILIAPYFYALLFPTYGESVFYSQLAVLALLLFPKKLMGIALTVQKQKRALWLLECLNLTSKAGLLLLLVPTYGVLGAIMAFLGNNLLYCLGLIYFMYGRKPRNEI